MLRFKSVDDVAIALVRIFEDKVKALGNQAEKFLDDFKDASDNILRKFLEYPNLVDAWRKMNDLGADDALRRNVGALEALSKPKGSRPDPSTYLDQNYINNHLAKFDDGAVRFTTQSKINQHKTLGNAEAFTLPRREYDRLFEETGGNLTQIEQRLGLNAGDLTGDDVVIAWIKKQDLGEVRMPSGNEGGVIDEFWIPGGKTSGGVSEGIVDLSNPNIPYTKL